MTAALGALLAPAAAGAASAEASKAKKKRTKTPVITAVKPMNVAIGETLEIRGRNFLRGRNKNSVVFKRDGGKAVFVKADVGTAKLLRVKIPAKLQAQFALSADVQRPTRFRLRVLAKKFGKSFTRVGLSPIVSVPRPAQAPGFAPSQPDGDCDGDGVLNRNQADDDGDLLSDDVENAIGTNGCNPDSDGDGVEDGFEYQSARDLNDDEDQRPNTYLPYPGKRPYPNPLFSDANVDYDGDSLTLAEEQSLWKYTYQVTHTDSRTLSPLSYSDGEQYSRSQRGADGLRRPTLSAANYDKHTDFVNWAIGAGYRVVGLSDGAPWWNSATTRRSYGLFDVNRSAPNPAAPNDGESNTETFYFDFDLDTYLSDDERDEDADGLSNYDEAHGRMRPEYWATCYSIEARYHIDYAATNVADADTDGDGVRDGADDQDHDDIPNLMELSRFAASGGLDETQNGRQCVPEENLPTPPATNHPDAYGRINPFNPCLPATWSRTCDRHPAFGGAGAPFDGSPNWYSLN